MREYREGSLKSHNIEFFVMCHVDDITRCLFIVFAYIVILAMWLITNICIRYPILKATSDISSVGYYYDASC